MGAAAELVRKGGAILNEPCPNCGGLQLKYKGRNICINCGDLSSIEKAGAISVSDAILDVHDLAVRKIGEAVGQLSGESDTQRQKDLAELLLKYLELLDRTSEPTSHK